jgi:hypothetical protein
MQFNDTTNLTGVIQQCERYCNLGSTGISGVTNTLKEFTTYVNKTNRDVWQTIFNAYGGWQYDDSNYTDLPIATTALVSGTGTYAIPTGSLTVRGVEVLDEGNVWNKLEPITDEQIRQYIAEGEFYKEDGSPRFYKLINDTIKLYPSPDYSQDASLKVYYDRGSVDFASTDTTKTAGFVSEFHDILPIGASITYWTSKPQGSDAYNKLQIDYQRIMANLKNYYSQKFHQQFPPRITVRDSLKDYI